MRLMSALLFLSLSSASVYAFDNIEADALYNGPIKDKIQAEYIQALALLKAQASSLNMEVRKKDFDALREHMYDKALLVGSCIDRGVTIKKSVSGANLSDKFVQRCVDSHLKFMNSLKGVNWTASMVHCEEGSWYNDPNVPYDFLGYSSEVLRRPRLSIINYIKLKECFDKRSSTDKLLDHLGD